MGDVSFRTCAGPSASGKELPTFKFGIGEIRKGKVLGTVSERKQLSSNCRSEGIAGVSMQLEPGVMRELHWHATAAEWAFVLKGRVRTTVINPLDKPKRTTFDPGDMWYFPRGHPHVLECLGNEPTHFILFSITVISPSSARLVSPMDGALSQIAAGENFGLPQSAFDGFPVEKSILPKARFPPEQTPENLQGPRLLHRRRTSFVCLRATAWRVQRRSRMACRLDAISNFNYVSPASFSTSNRVHSASCIGIPTLTMAIHYRRRGQA